MVICVTLRYECLNKVHSFFFFFFSRKHLISQPRLSRKCSYIKKSVIPVYFAIVTCVTVLCRYAERHALSRAKEVLRERLLSMVRIRMNDSLRPSLHRNFSKFSREQSLRKLVKLCFEKHCEKISA